jgi:hypothetical protein
MLEDSISAKGRITFRRQFWTRATSFGILGIILLSVQSGLQGESSLPDSSGKEGWYRSEWDLRIDQIDLTQSTLSAASGSLKNLSDRPARIDLRTTAEALFVGIRVWRKGLEGSYRLRVKPNILAHHRQKFVVMQPGDVVQLHWEEGVAPSQSAYEFIFSPVHSAPLPDVGNVTLPPGEYVIDSTIDLWATSPQVRDSEFKTITLCTK